MATETAQNLRPYGFTPAKPKKKSRWVLKVVLMTLLGAFVVIAFLPIAMS